MRGVRTRRRVSAETVETSARSVARVLLAKAEGPVDEPPTWLVVAKALGVRVLGFYGLPGDGPGYYEAATQTVYYNLRAPKSERARYIVHELAHRILATWPGGGCQRVALERYDDDRQTVQHRVARRVEEIVLGCAG